MPLPLIALMLFLTPASSYCEISGRNDAVKVYQEVQGLEWMEMSAGERMDHLMAAMYLLNKNGVELSYTPDYYYDAIYQKIQRHPELYSSEIASILANFIYEKEEKARPALDNLKRHPTNP